MQRNNPDTPTSYSDGVSKAVRRVSRKQLVAIALTILMALSMPIGPTANSGFANPGAEYDTQSLEADSYDINPSLATTAEDNTSYYDDFEDGNIEGWNSTEDKTTITSESFWGEHSLNATEHSFTNYSSWEEGPAFDTQETFEVTGTYKPSADGGTVRLGLVDKEETLESGANASSIQIRHFFDDGVTRLDTNTYATAEDDSKGFSDEEIPNDFNDQWVQFRFAVSAGEVDLKLWDAGTEEPEEWMITHTAPEMESEFMLFTDGTTSRDRNIVLDEIDAGGHAVSGQFVDQDGNPVPNAIVEGVGVDYADVEARLEEQADDFEGTAEELREEAERMLDEAEGVGLPETWDEDYDLDSHMDDADGTYLLAHSVNDWGGVGGISTTFSSDIDEPRLQFGSDEEIVLTAWDASDSSGIFGNPVDNSFPGSTTEQNIVIREWEASASYDGYDHQHTDSQLHEPEVLTTTTSGEWGSTDHYGVRTHLSTGIYEVYPQHNRERGYTIMVGDAEDQWNALETELRAEAGDLEDDADERAARAQNLLDNINIGEMERRTTTTDENGEFEIRFQTGVERAAIQGYRADGEILTDITGPNFDDLRTAAEQGYNGTYVLSAPQRHGVPEEGVTLEGFRADELPNHPLETFDDFLEWKQEQILDDRVDELRSEYDERFAEMNRTRLETTYDTHRGLIEVAPGAEDRYLERSTFDEIQDAEDLTDDELAEETRHMQVALANTDNLAPKVDDPGDVIDISDGELNAEYPLPGGTDEDTITPELHWSDGTSEEIPEEYWTIESGVDLFGSDTLVIDGYPIDDESATVDLRVRGASSGGVLDDRISASNPAFQGVVPDVRAVDLNTMSPGSSETVSMNLRTGDDGGLDSLASVEVFGPEGQQIAADVDASGSASFTTAGAGQHFIRATMVSSSGDEFVQTFSVRALEEGRSNYATVRAETVTGSDKFLAIAGDGLRDAEIAADNDRLGVTAIVPAGNTPSRVDVKAEAAMGPRINNLDIRVLEGSDEKTIDTSVETVIHFDSLDEDAAIWRGEPAWAFGEPMEVGEASRHGEVIERENGKVVLRTYTEGDGSLSMHINPDPDFAEGLKHSVALSVPSISLWWVPLSAVSGLALGIVLRLVQGRRLLPKVIYP